MVFISDHFGTARRCQNSYFVHSSSTYELPSIHLRAIFLLMNRHTNRRRWLKHISASLLGITAAPLVRLSANAPLPLASTSGRIRHSLCRWTFHSVPLEELCLHVKPLGIESIELTTPDEWPILRKHGLTCAVATHRNVSLTKGFNNPQYHAQLQVTYRQLIDQAADAGIGQVIVFSGNRNGINDAEGLEYCAQGLDPLVKQAERRGVRIIMELLNSKVDHPDYQCDHTSWGVALVDKIGSPQFKLLYDIYHMQIMEGDIIATITQFKDYIAHYHTAGVPGRHEIDHTQELNYPAIMRAIADTGFKGFVAQEFIPKSEYPFLSLATAIRLCSVQT